MSSPSMRPESYGSGGKNSGTVPEFFRNASRNAFSFSSRVCLLDKKSTVKFF